MNNYISKTFITPDGMVVGCLILPPLPVYYPTRLKNKHKAEQRRIAKGRKHFEARKRKHPPLWSFKSL